MLVARINFELQIIFDRVNEMIPEYEKHKPARQEHITNVKFNKKKRYVRIFFNTYAYEITHPKETYILTWYRKLKSDADEYVKDGFIECADLAAVVRTIDDYLYGAFCPARSAWWQINEKPKHFSRNKRWGP